MEKQKGPPFVFANCARKLNKYPQNFQLDRSKNIALNKSAKTSRKIAILCLDCDERCFLERSIDPTDITFVVLNKNKMLEKKLTSEET